LEVEITFVCGDGGGGAASHFIHPECVKIGVMPEHSDFVNCLMHAHLAYKTACNDLLGNQGMNTFPSKELILEHHYMGRESIVINRGQQQTFNPGK
jgi:hypothetical protein